MSTMLWRNWCDLRKISCLLLFSKEKRVFNWGGSEFSSRSACIITGAPKQEDQLVTSRLLDYCDSSTTLCCQIHLSWNYSSRFWCCASIIQIVPVEGLAFELPSVLFLLHCPLFNHKNPSSSVITLILLQNWSLVHFPSSLNRNASGFIIESFHLANPLKKRLG